MSNIFNFQRLEHTARSLFLPISPVGNLQNKPTSPPIRADLNQTGVTGNRLHNFIRAPANRRASSAEPGLFRSSGSCAELRKLLLSQGEVNSADACQVRGWLAGAGLIEARQRRQVDGAPLRLASGDKTIPGWLFFFPLLHFLPLLPCRPAGRPTAEPAHSPRKSRFKAVPGIDLTANLQRRFACGHALIRPAFLFRPLSFRRNPPPAPPLPPSSFLPEPTKQ